MNEFQIVLCRLAMKVRKTDLRGGRAVVVVVVVVVVVFLSSGGNGPAVTGGARDGLTATGRGATTHGHRPRNSNSLA